jgi:hypothetical protein
MTIQYLGLRNMRAFSNSLKSGDRSENWGKNMNGISNFQTTDEQIWRKGTCQLREMNQFAASVARTNNKKRGCLKSETYLDSFWPVMGKCLIV